MGPLLVEVKSKRVFIKGDGHDPYKPGEYITGLLEQKMVENTYQNKPSLTAKQLLEIVEEVRKIERKLNSTFKSRLQFVNSTQAFHTIISELEEQAGILAIAEIREGMKKID